MKSLFSITAAALPFFGVADAFWRMGCSVIQTGRVDPLVNPGAVAAHAHTIVGGSNIGVNATYESLLDSECTSCEVSSDKSAYWTPLLYYWYPNGTFVEVPHGGSVVYYLARVAGTPIIPFPKGFKMLSGNKAARSYDNETLTFGNATYPGRPVADRVSFACLTAGVSPPSQPYMFNVTQCINGMRAQIAFQSCWNGVDLYKADNSHVAYLSQIDNGICPPGFPFAFPTIFVETDYAPEQVPDATEDDRFVFSMGDPTGFGFHGDFQNGWEQDVLVAAINECLLTNPTGVVNQCPILAQYDSNGYGENCPERPSQINENAHGMIDKLPGCITVTYGPDQATSADMECNATVTQPHIFATKDSIPYPTVSPEPGSMYGLIDQEYLGCYNDSAAGIRALNAISMVNYTVMSVEFCQGWCNDRGYRLSGVEYAQECHCDNYLNPTVINANGLPYNQCTWNCGGTMTVGGQQELCGGLAYIDIYNNTNPHFNAFGSNVNSAGLAQKYSPPAPFAANYLGCYSDMSSSGRALTGPQNQNQNMTIEYCGQLCAAGTGYQYYGLEYYDQCFCGNFISNNATLLTPTTSPNNGSCNTRCLGSEPEICGGPDVISIYNNTGYRAPEIVPSVGSYQSQGCLTDPGNANGRSLQPGVYFNDTGMTVEMCVAYCQSAAAGPNAPYNYAGVEYSYQCYCGNSIVAGTGVVETCDVTKLLLCSGNPYEYCGGPSLMNLYVNQAVPGRTKQKIPAPKLKAGA